MDSDIIQKNNDFGDVISEVVVGSNLANGCTQFNRANLTR